MSPKKNNNYNDNNEFFLCLPIFAVTLYFLSCFLNSAVPPVQKQRIIWSKIKLRIILLNRSRGGDCFALEICVTKPLWHLGIRRCYKILCKQSNLVWVYCFLNDFSLFRINYFACCHNKNPLKYYSSILRHCNWC